MSQTGEVPKRPTGAFLAIRKLKALRLTVDPTRHADIDQAILAREPELTHEEAVYLVRQYEIGIPCVIPPPKDDRGVWVPLSAHVEALLGKE